MQKLKISDIIIAMNRDFLEKFLDNNKKYFTDDIKWSSANAKKIQLAEKYSLFEEFKNKKYPKGFYELAKQYDNMGYISKTDATKLKDVFFDEDSVIGIHRTNMAFAEDITRDGLFLTGHSSQAAFSSSENSSSKTVSLSGSKGAKASLSLRKSRWY